jgi:hypothetical protein
LLAIFDRSDTPGLNVTKHVTVAAQEYDAVTGWIGFVPLEFVIRDFNFRSDVDVRPAARVVGPVVGDYRVGFAVSDMDFISPVRVGFAAARRIRNIRLHQGLVPLPDSGIYRFPLSQIAGVQIGNQATQNTKTKENALHPSRSSTPGEIVKAMFVPSIAAHEVLQGAKKNRIFFDKLNLLDNPLNFTPAWGGPWAVQESTGHTPTKQETASASVPLTEARELGE